MKRQYLIFIMILILTSALLLFADFSPFNILRKRNISLDKSVLKKVESTIEKSLYENEITKPIISTTLIIFKKERITELWVTDEASNSHKILTDSISLINTQSGTRLYDNESIIPEGIYEIATVDSDKNLSFTIDFPNDFDQQKQQTDNRPELLSTIGFNSINNDIFLSKNIITEFLFLAKTVKAEHTKIIILPNDLRVNKSIPYCSTCPQWIEELYGTLRIEILKF
jgi:hypothetical protein